MPKTDVRFFRINPEAYNLVPGNSKIAVKKRVWVFLSEKFGSHTAFTAMEIADAIGLDGHRDKVFQRTAHKGLLMETEEGSYRVCDQFRNYATWSAFRDSDLPPALKVGSKYTHSTLTHLLVFEFYMPLRHEVNLRQQLDSLFYLDTIKSRLRLLGAPWLTDATPPFLSS